MSYKLKQIVKEPGELISTTDSENLQYMTPIQIGGVGVYNQPGDTTDSGNTSTIQDQCVKVPLSKGTSYYFHGKIKRASTVQNFNIKLVKMTDANKIQFVKSITVAAGVEFADIEFIFTPAADFDAIVFELHRTSSTNSTPVIVYQELSAIGNILVNGEIAIKLGVQSKPGLMMCINGQEIRVGNSGIYELRNGVVKATHFCVISPAIDVNYPSNINESICLFNSDKKRAITPFILDYVYEKED